MSTTASSNRRTTWWTWEAINLRARTYPEGWYALADGSPALQDLDSHPAARHLLAFWQIFFLAFLIPAAIFGHILLIVG